MTDADPVDVDALTTGLTGRLADGRRRLLRELVERGYSAEELREAVADDRLAVLLLEQVLRETASLTAEEVATACDVDVTEVLRVHRLLGLSSRAIDEPVFVEETCEAMRIVQAVQSYGLSQPAVDAVLGVLGQRMWQLAADVLIIVGDELARPGDSEYELAHRYADAARVLAPMTMPIVACVFEAHLQERMREIFVTADDAEHGALRATTDVAVAFIDVVGFTRLGERVEADELKSVAARLADVVFGTLGDGPVRLVKTVGDATLLMSRDTTALVDVLAKAFSAVASGADLPALHAGISVGRAYVGGADVYGAPVNLASRLADLAPSGRIWAAEPVVAACPRFAWREHGAERVKGAASPVAVFELMLE